MFHQPRDNTILNILHPDLHFVLTNLTWSNSQALRDCRLVRVMPIQTHPLPTPTTKRLFESIAQCPAGMPLEREPR